MSAVPAETGPAAPDAAAPTLPWALEARDLGKVFRHYPSPRGRLLEWASFGRLKRHRAIWALSDVSFAIRPGEAVAVLGENGAGKSTLLSLLLGTTRASTGWAAIRGEATGLLELGLGLKPDFTGRANAELALMMRGIDRAQIVAEGLVEAVAEFAELGEAFDWPMRTYSTGMQMRLAFAAATARRPEILVVDEALAVGDAPFQYKCIERIRSFKAAGSTLLFVSHELASLRTLCDRGLLLSAGRLVADGPIEAVLDRYNALLADRHGPIRIAQERLAGAEGEGARTRTRSGDGRVRLAGWRLTGADGAERRIFQSGAPARLTLELAAREAVGPFALGLLLRNALGLDVFGTNTAQRGVALGPLAAGQGLTVTVDLTLALGPGRYFLTLAAHAGQTHLAGNFDWIDNAMDLEILPDPRAPGIGAAALPVSIAVAEQESKGGG